MREFCLRKLDLSAKILLEETGFAFEMDGSEFQEMYTEDLSRWMKDKGVQDCYCEVFQGEYVVCVCTWCLEIFL